MDAVGEFRRHFIWLDWDYMLDRNEGELLCDVGVTFHANHTEALVGLWRLDSLEASFGAAGFLMGNLHRINTMALYGSLQAVAKKDRAQLTHVVYRLSYNQAYDVTRFTDNARNLFQEQQVYDLDPRYIKDVQQVCKIYSGQARKTPYGVRDEFRVGAAALKDIAEHIDAQVRSGSTTKMKPLPTHRIEWNEPESSYD